MAASTSSLFSSNPRIAFSATKSTAISNPLSQTLSFAKSFHGLRLSAAAPPSLSLSPAKSLTVKASASQHVEFDRSKELEKKSHSIRRSLKQELRKAGSLKEKWKIHGKIQSLPRKFAPTRIRRRCFVTGRARSVYRDFGLSRHVLREMVHACLLPGATRSSW